MDNLFAIGVGLVLRAVVDHVTHHNHRVNGSLVGLWEGAVLHHFLTKFPSSIDPYVAFVFRLFVDLLFTESLTRTTIVVLWTGLGMLLSDLSVEMFDDKRFRSTWRRVRRYLPTYTLSTSSSPARTGSTSRVQFMQVPSSSSTLASNTTARSPLSGASARSPTARQPHPPPVASNRRTSTRPIPGSFSEYSEAESDVSRVRRQPPPPSATPPSDLEYITLPNIPDTPGREYPPVVPARARAPSDVSGVVPSDISIPPALSQVPPPVTRPYGSISRMQSSMSVPRASSVSSSRVQPNVASPRMQPNVPAPQVQSIVSLARSATNVSAPRSSTNVSVPRSQSNVSVLRRATMPAPQTQPPVPAPVSRPRAPSVASDQRAASDASGLTTPLEGRSPRINVMSPGANYSGLTTPAGVLSPAAGGEMLPPVTVYDVDSRGRSQQHSPNTNASELPPIPIPLRPSGGDSKEALLAAAIAEPLPSPGIPPPEGDMGDIPDAEGTQGPPPYSEPMGTEIPEVVQATEKDADADAGADSRSEGTMAESLISGHNRNSIIAHADVLRKQAMDEEAQRAALRRELEQAKREHDHWKAFRLKVESEEADQTARQLHAKAARRYFKAHNMTPEPQTIDVHRLKVPEAITKVERALYDAVMSGAPELRIITGQGKHSAGKIPRLKLAIIGAMQDHHIEAVSDVNNAGVLVVRTPPQPPPEGPSQS